MTDPSTAANERTGRYLLSYLPGEASALTAALRDQAGMRSVAASSDLGDDAFGASAQDLPEMVLFPRLSAAVVFADDERLAAVGRTCAGLPMPAPEPEQWVYSSGAPVPIAVDGALTWGLQAVGVPASARTGRGVRVAVLDTGLDPTHPDLGARAVQAASFVRGEDAVDVQGHGTHCAGTLCGPRRPQGPTRYGVAPELELYVGKVLGNDGRGREGDVLAGIDWAVERGCRIVSMSLGSRAVPGDSYSQVFEQVAAALAAATPGTVLVAAAGNDSARSRGLVAPIGRPASCPTVVSVAAVDAALEVAEFSNAGAEPGGGQIDVAAPGVAVLSAYPEPDGPYVLLSGTSMAAPHVAGVLALLAEARPEAGVPELVRELTATSRPLAAEPRDVGAGLVQAPA